LDRGKRRPKYEYHGWFTEKFSESHTGYGASFTVTGGLLTAETSSLKRVSGRIFKISTCFKEATQDFIFHFLRNKAAKKLKTIGVYTESTDFIFKTFKKIIHLVTLSL
jgi:hypothetical protein